MKIPDRGSRSDRGLANIAIAKNEYQCGFSAMHPEAMYNRDGRLAKAAKTMAVMDDYLAETGQQAADLSLLDIGCSTGFLTKVYGRSFGHVLGIDIDEEAVRHAQSHNSDKRTKFRAMDSMNLDLEANSLDAATCTHVYEHVPDSTRLMDQIHRVLRPGGFCYFAAANRLLLMEPHYRLPLLSVLPKPLAHRYVRLAGKADSYYENLLWYWQLKRLVRRFEVIDYTGAAIRDPEKYRLTDVLRAGSAMHWMSRALVNLAYWAVPSYIWILRKP